MPPAEFTTNPRARLQLLQAGAARTPVMVVDDFLADTAPLVAAACERADYGPDATSRYPGLRAPLPRDYVRAVLDRLTDLLFSVYALPPGLAIRPVNAVYSLIATPEHELEPGQCVPHFDSPAPHYLAILHYLNPGPFGDTGLFRHRATGLERICAETLPGYQRARSAEHARDGAPPRAYPRGSDAHFELHTRLPYRANRLVVYPGGLLHSGLVDPAVDVNADPRSGRLTANLFVDGTPVQARA